MTMIDSSIFDASGLAAVKRGAKAGDPQALKAAARQFEALFMQMVLKSMRDATPREGLFDSEQTRMYESLLDQQLAQVLTAKGGTGLAAMIEKQLLRIDERPDETGNGARLDFPVENSNQAPFPPASPASSARDFVDRLWPGATEASRVTGIPAHFMVAQAALETGWGHSEPRHADGRSSYNVFGIKAGRSWTGEVVEAVTTEIEEGAPRRRNERFRAYGSYEEAFRDYAGLLTGNPRYAGVVGSQEAAAFARGLQRAGYATDPMYAVKLERIIGGASLRTALSG